MAELATLARPYADAAFQVAEKGDLSKASAELDALAAVAANPPATRHPGADPGQPGTADPAEPVQVGTSGRRTGQAPVQPLGDANQEVACVVGAFGTTAIDEGTELTSTLLFLILLLGPQFAAFDQVLVIFDDPGNVLHQRTQTRRCSDLAMR